MNFFGTEIRTPPVKADVFERYESAVRSYCRSFPAVFTRALGSRIWDERDADYLDFLSGAGALNYGHNHPQIRSALMAYLESNGIVHALDLHTQAKRAFIEALQDAVLRPRGLSYRMQFTGPTGTNAVEAALKLARKVTGRHTVIAFTNAFHGMSLGALAASGTRSKRAGAGVPLSLVTRMPFDGYAGESVDTLALLEACLDDPGSGVDVPAAIILETVQAEGGLHVARPEWLAGLAAIAQRNNILLILDEIQTGCGRTGTFFSFERAKLNPDIVCLSKSISGYGLPLSLVLIKPELDAWAPGEHNGTFRGNNLAFVAGASALDLWRDAGFERSLAVKSRVLSERLRSIGRNVGAEVRGIGLLQGLQWPDPAVAPLVSRLAFERGLIVETCGARNDVLKLLPPLTVELDDLSAGLDIIEDAALAALRTLFPHGADTSAKPAA
jgi:diaminobutyrate-2-oxoglutarate transaminase